MDLLSGAADHVAVAVFDVPEKIKEQQMMGRIEQPVSPVIGRAVQFIGDFLGDQPAGNEYPVQSSFQNLFWKNRAPCMQWWSQW